MHEFSEATTIREIVARYPAACRLFDEWAIDYCCGGGRTLQEVAAESGLRVEHILGALKVVLSGPAAAPGEAENWYDRPTEDLLDHIVSKHHTYLRQELPRLEALVDKIARVHTELHGDQEIAGEKAGAVLHRLSATYGGLKRAMEEHLQTEEQEVFPLLRASLSSAAGSEAPARLRQQVEQLEREHDTVGEGLKALRFLSGNYFLPEWACPTFENTYAGLQALEADIHQHVHLENNLLFPRVREST
jgi:regulator of cell morphogenesis and NO signaling